MARGDELQERLVRFSVRIATLIEHLPRTSLANHVGKQMLRSATAAAPNYAEARGAESRNDFVHKLGITYKELNETEVWLATLIQKKVLPEHELLPALCECKELCRIIAASRSTARRGLNSPQADLPRRS